MPPRAALCRLLKICGLRLSEFHSNHPCWNDEEMVGRGKKKGLGGNLFETTPRIGSTAEKLTQWRAHSIGCKWSMKDGVLAYVNLIHDESRRGKLPEPSPRKYGFPPSANEVEKNFSPLSSWRGKLISAKSYLAFHPRKIRPSTSHESDNVRVRFHLCFFPES